MPATIHHRHAPAPCGKISENSVFNLAPLAIRTRGRALQRSPIELLSPGEKCGLGFFQGVQIHAFGQAGDAIPTVVRGDVGSSLLPHL
jgi:hypothetical protein